MKSSNILVFGLLLLLTLDPATLEGTEVATALETEGSDKSLDFGTVQDKRSTSSPLNIVKITYAFV